MMPEPGLPKIPVHVLSGFLGTGKTTAVRALLDRRGKKERIALVINEFGDLGIDGALLSDCASCLLMEVPGGCVCCTALADLESSLEEILQLAAPDRIVIEPTGLARSSDIVDVLRRPAWEGRVDLRPVITFVDPGLDLARQYEEGGLFRDQIDAGDYLVINRCDLASPGQIETAEAFLRELFPPKLGIHRTSFGVLPDAVLRPAGNERRAASKSLPSVSPLPTKRSSRKNSVEGFEGRGWTFPAQRVFAAEDVARFLEILRTGEGLSGSVARAKGILQTTAGWKVFELAGGTLHSGPSSYRRDNRFDLVLKGGSEKDLETLQELLSRCLIREDEPLLSLETETGQIATFDRRRLVEIEAPGALPGEIPLKVLLLSQDPARTESLVGSPGEPNPEPSIPGLPWLWLISERGLFGTGARRELLERGRIVFSEKGEFLTEENGGPFRFEISDEEARGFEDEVDRCRSVPALCALRLAALPGSRTVPPLPLPKGFAESEGLDLSL